MPLVGRFDRANRETNTADCSESARWKLSRCQLVLADLISNGLPKPPSFLLFFFFLFPVRLWDAVQNLFHGEFIRWIYLVARRDTFVSKSRWIVFSAFHEGMILKFDTWPVLFDFSIQTDSRKYPNFSIFIVDKVLHCEKFTRIKCNECWLTDNEDLFVILRFVSNLNNTIIIREM